MTFTAVLCAPLRTAGQHLELNTPGLSLTSHNYLCKAGKKEKWGERQEEEEGEWPGEGADSPWCRGGHGGSPESRRWRRS